MKSSGETESLSIIMVIYIDQTILHSCDNQKNKHDGMVWIDINIAQ